MIDRTYSAAEYAAILLGPGPDGTPATVEPHKIQWLEKRLRGDAEPALPGFKAGRKWRATQADVDAAVDLLRPRPAVRVELPPVPMASSMTRTSRRRLAAS